MRKDLLFSLVNIRELYRVKLIVTNFVLPLFSGRLRELWIVPHFGSTVSNESSIKFCRFRTILRQQFYADIPESNSLFCVLSSSLVLAPSIHPFKCLEISFLRAGTKGKSRADSFHGGELSAQYLPDCFFLSSGMKKAPPCRAANKDMTTVEKELALLVCSTAEL